MGFEVGFDMVLDFLTWVLTWVLAGGGGGGGGEGEGGGGGGRREGGYRLGQSITLVLMQMLFLSCAEQVFRA